MVADASGDEDASQAAEIVLENDSTGAQTEKHQKRMMGEINKLIEGSTKGIGYLEPADFERTVTILLSSESTPAPLERSRTLRRRLARLFEALLGGLELLEETV